MRDYAVSLPGSGFTGPVEVVAVATSALRPASKPEILPAGSSMLSPEAAAAGLVSDLTASGINTTIISQDEEASLGFYSAVSTALNNDVEMVSAADAIVWDLGGGKSTSYVQTKRTRVFSALQPSCTAVHPRYLWKHAVLFPG
jgi:exopolyphosphatase/pppGpp-phosphohydrolase